MKSEHLGRGIGYHFLIDRSILKFVLFSFELGRSHFVPRLLQFTVHNAFLNSFGITCSQKLLKHHYRFEMYWLVDVPSGVAPEDLHYVHTICSYIPDIFFAINNHYFPVRHSYIGLSNVSTLCYLWGMDWIYLCNAYSTSFQINSKRPVTKYASCLISNWNTSGVENNNAACPT